MMLVARLRENKYMSKAILVMDMPDSCFHCDCCHEKPYDIRYQIEGENFCGIENMEVDDYYAGFYSGKLMRPSWCPLKALPSEINGEIKIRSDEYSDGFTDGFNSCLDEIYKLE